MSKKVTEDLKNSDYTDDSEIVDTDLDNESIPVDLNKPTEVKEVKQPSVEIEDVSEKDSRKSC